MVREEIFCKDDDDDRRAMMMQILLLRLAKVVDEERFGTIVKGICSGSVSFTAKTSLPAVFEVLYVHEESINYCNVRCVQ